MKIYKFLIVSEKGTKVYYCNGKSLAHAKARAKLFLYAVGELDSDE